MKAGDRVRIIADAKKIEWLYIPDDCVKPGDEGVVWSCDEDTVRVKFDKNHVWSFSPEDVEAVSKKVRINVGGGLAYVVDKPRGVEIVIRDYDIDGWREDDAVSQDESGSDYCEVIYEADEEWEDGNLSA